MTVVSVVKEAEARRMTITSRFDAPIARVWAVWSDPRRWRVRRVAAPHTLEFEDGFADADGRPAPDAPIGLIRVDLSELTGGGTQMVITTEWASDEAMERILAKGTDAGMTAAVGQIDELLGLPGSGHTDQPHARRTT